MPLWLSQRGREPRSSLWSSGPHVIWFQVSCLASPVTRALTPLRRPGPLARPQPHLCSDLGASRWLLPRLDPPLSRAASLPPRSAEAVPGPLACLPSAARQRAPFSAGLPRSVDHC